MSTETSERVFPTMGAEGGFESEESVPPLRVSGYICLILGLFSIAAVVHPAALAAPIFGILFGLFAIRRHGELVPVGMTAARIGLVLAVGFGACGFFIPWMKSATLGAQAEQFARYYVEVIARDDLELAMELRKNFRNRFPTTMPLKAHYSLNNEAEDALIEFRKDSINDQIRKRGVGAEWKLERAPRIYSRYQIQHAELILVDPSGQDPIRLYMVLEYTVHPRTGDGEWHLRQATQYIEQIYAPQVL